MSRGLPLLRFSLRPFLLLLFPLPVFAQAGGAIAGRVRDAVTNQAIVEALVTLDDGRRGTVTDATGAYRLREVRSGYHRIVVRIPGYRPAQRDSVLVASGETTVLEFALQPQAVEVAPVVVEAPDVVLDPLSTADVQRITAAEIRRLPVTTLEEAIALSAGAVGESYRGGRVGEQSFILDGLGVKNQLDASSGPLGVRIPPDVLTEASLVTNGFSARYGQALSGIVNVVTKDGGERWGGRLAYESDRALGRGWDWGFDRLVVQTDGPLAGGARLLAAVDAVGRLDADPVHAPIPADTLDPRAARPWLLPHNGGEQLDAAVKLTGPLGARQTVRLFALGSLDRRLLFDPAYKYEAGFAPARRVSGRLLSAHLQHTPGPRSENGLIADLRVGYFTREFVRGTLDRPIGYQYRPFSGHDFRVVGEDLARARDTVGARAPIAGLGVPQWSEATPWGVPAFFLGGASRGEVAWNRFRELRSQLDLAIGGGRDVDFYLGGEVVSQRVQTFQRIRGYLPVGISGSDTVPPAAASDFRPLSAAVYGETQLRWQDLGFTLGLRYDQFDPRADLSGNRIGPRRSLNPRFAVSTVLTGATFVASWGRFSQVPDFQYLVDAAFDDTLRTGRFRRGNPNLGYENSTQYEFSVRARPTGRTSVRVNAYVKQLGGLVASVPLGLDADSTIFGNTDYGNVKGVEIIAERELSGGLGVRVAYTLQRATATATDAFQLLRRIRLSPDSVDTIIPARVEFPLDYDRRHSIVAILQARIAAGAWPEVLGVRPLAGLEAAAIVRYVSGLPFSRTNERGDTLIGLPNSYRLPAQSTVDLLLRRPLSIGGIAGSLYLDGRNLFNRRNVDAVRRDTGEPDIGEQQILRMAQAAYLAHPEPIPYESPRYRAWADLDRDGLLSGPTELMPLYLRAARDVSQPLFAFGPPRLVRLGIELVF